VLTGHEPKARFLAFFELRTSFRAVDLINLDEPVIGPHIFREGLTNQEGAIAMAETTAKAVSNTDESIQQQTITTKEPIPHFHLPLLGMQGF
jgi:hypothetical protein